MKVHILNAKTMNTTENIVGTAGTVLASIPNPYTKVAGWVLMAASIGIKLLQKKKKIQYKNSYFTIVKLSYNESTKEVLYEDFLDLNDDEAVADHVRVGNSIVNFYTPINTESYSKTYMSLLEKSDPLFAIKFGEFWYMPNYRTEKDSDGKLKSIFDFYLDSMKYEIINYDILNCKIIGTNYEILSIFRFNNKLFKMVSINSKLEDGTSEIEAWEVL